MRAACYRSYGDPSVLAVEEIDPPRAGAGQIRIRAAASSVNPADWKLRFGYLAEYVPLQFPAIPGHDAAGVVDEIGDGVEGVSVGDRVFGVTMMAGAAAENVVLIAWAPIPDTLTVAQAAGAGLAGVAGVRALELLDLSSGQTLLIEGAAGGVGSITTHVATARGLTVIGTASENNHEYLRSIGAIPTTYGEGLRKRVAALASGGVDGILDAAGSGSLGELVTIAGSPDHVVTLADFNASAVGVRLVNGLSGSPGAGLQEIARLAATGQLTVTVTETFPLEKIADAHILSQSRHVRGKLVLTI